MGKLRLERKEIDIKREAFAKEMNAARERLTWDNFVSVPAEKEAELKKVYHSFIAMVQAYDWGENAMEGRALTTRSTSTRWRLQCTMRR